MLDAPPGRRTRPVTDRAKESLFNILGSRFGQPGTLPAFPVLDVFAGAGSFGIEALSRGASRCRFIERDPVAIRTLRGNLARLRLMPEVAQLAPVSAWNALPPPWDMGYGLVFVDPPYRDSESAPRVVGLLEQVGSQLAEEGLIVFRLSAGTAFNAQAPPSLRLEDERVIGTMRILLYTSNVNPEEEAPSRPLP